MEPPLIVDSARKHGIADEDVLHAFSHPVRYEDLDEWLRDDHRTNSVRSTR